MSPQRIVSLLPSATEILCLLGLEDQIVGITHECDFPPSITSRPVVTQTVIPHHATSREIDTLVREKLQTSKALYSLDFDLLETLQPDLLVTQALCDVCAVSEEEVTAAACSLSSRPKVVNLEPSTLSEVFDCILAIGQATHSEDTARQRISELQARVDAVRTRSEQIKHKPRVTLLEWIDPLFCCGHWSPELIRYAGGFDPLGREHAPSTTITPESLIDAQPNVLILALCGYSVEQTLNDYPLLEAIPGFRDLPCYKTGRIYTLDGSAYFSRPGPRLVDSLEILAHTLFPDLHPAPPHLPLATKVFPPFN